MPLIYLNINYFVCMMQILYTYIILHYIIYMDYIYIFVYIYINLCMFYKYTYVYIISRKRV